MTLTEQQTAPRTFMHYVYNEKKARRVCRFLETRCYMSEGKFAGKPIRLRDWQRHMVSELFGWEDTITGLRRYRTAFWFLPKKNGKSSLIAGLALYMLIADKENAAQVILASNSKEQSKMVFRPACGMVEQSPELDGILDVRKSGNRILHDDSGSFLQVIPADAKTQQGLSISCLIYDEVADAPTRDLYDNLTSASKAREQPLKLFITTAGRNNEGIGYELYKRAKAILADPELDPTFYPVIYELDTKEDWTSEENWYKVNPALGDFNQIADMRAEFQEALTSTGAQGKFKMFSLNQWVQAADSWLDVEKWKTLYDPNFDESTLKNVPCYLGLDLSITTDLTAIAAVWDLGNKRYYVKPMFFLPEDGLQKRIIRDGVPYDSWIENKWIIANPGAEIDLSFVQKFIEDFAAEYNVKIIGVDPYHARELVGRLEKNGLTVVKLVQGHPTLAEPSSEFESAIIGGRIQHDGNPCLQWQIGHVVARRDANNNIIPDKNKSTKRIDGLSASVTALGTLLKGAGLTETKPSGEFRVTIFG